MPFVLSVAVAFATGLLATPVHAQTLDAVCLGNIDLEFTPGLTLHAEPQLVLGEGEYLLCIPDDGLTAEISLEGLGDLSCLLGSAEAEVSATWSTGEESTIELVVDVIAGPAGATLGAEGAVTSGKFAGDNVSWVFAGLTLDPLSCLFGGVTDVNGTFEVTFTQP